ncbi:MAG: DUF4382 domain-containing protein, partial [Hydrococcus sp. Prado102]|nr:DUF4382 domain-containing protein [Hydrococcus sp. Prado102]
MTKIKKQFVFVALVSLLNIAILQSCGENQTQSESPATNSQPTENTADKATDKESGTLQIRANGEDFIRQGFVSKDGWQINFDRVYVTLADVTAYQSDPPFDAESGKTLQAKEQVSLPQTQTVDLAQGDENAEPILVGEVKAPAGRYNALSWRMVPAQTGEASGYPLYLSGKATKEGRTVDFVLKIQPEMAFTCGDFVGEQRKGILQADNNADLEATFHFDHLFGDAQTAPDDELNQGALGFEPFATLAKDGKLDADTTMLKEQLSQADYNKLMEILPSLGH